MNGFESERVKFTPEQTGFPEEMAEPGAGVPAQGVDVGGAKVKVKPFTGLTVELIVVAVQTLVAAVVAAQLVVVVLVWKSAVDAPVNPT